MKRTNPAVGNEHLVGGLVEPVAIVLGTVARVVVWREYRGPQHRAVRPRKPLVSVNCGVPSLLEAIGLGKRAILSVIMSPHVLK